MHVLQPLQVIVGRLPRRALELQIEDLPANHAPGAGCTGDHLDGLQLTQRNRRAIDGRLARKQGEYAVVATTGLILNRGPELKRVLAAIDRGSLRLVRS